MEAARAWLDCGNLLAKDSDPDVTKLGGFQALADAALGHLRAIQAELAEENAAQDNDAELFKVAVADIKVLNVLARITVMYSLYSYVQLDSLAPLPQVGSGYPFHSGNPDNDLMASYARKLGAVFAVDDDVSRLLLLSPDFTLAGMIAVLSFSPADFHSLCGKLPTSKLYDVLIRLRSVPRPLPLIVDTLARVPVDRPNAVYAIIETTLERKTKDASIDLSRGFEMSALVLLSVPPEAAKREYVQALGSQLLQVLCFNQEDVVEAAATIVSVLAERQPRFVGHLRDLILNPLSKAQNGSAMSLSALNHLLSSSRARHTAFVSHLSSKALGSLWLLAIDSRQNDGQYLKSYLEILAKLLNANPDQVLLLVSHLIITKLPSNLAWIVTTKDEPRLQTFLGSSNRHPDNPMNLINDRLDALVFIIQLMEDKTVTAILLCLIKEYVGMRPGKNYLHHLLLVKTIERVVSDTEIRSKVFGNVQEVLAFSFAVIETKVKDVLSRGAILEPGSNCDGLSALKLDDSDLSVPGNADSDDEDDSDVKTVGNATTEDNSMLVLLLALLGAALMEALGNKDLGLHVGDVANLEQKRCLHQIEEASEVFDDDVREKTQFCLNILDQKRSEPKPADFSNPQVVMEEANSALSEPLAASQAYGMHLISKLLESHDVSLHAAMAIFTKKLENDDSFVYLNAIKGIEVAAKTNSSSEVIELLQPLLKSDTKQLDKALRAREAFLRVLTPGSVEKVSSESVQILLSDLTARASESVDVRFRMSSAAMLGVIIAQFPASVPSLQQRDIADCALGILRFEGSEMNLHLRRSAVVLALEIINAINQGEFTNIPTSESHALVSEVAAVALSTTDETLRDHCNAVLDATKPSASS